jgi:transcription termination factor Rho
MGTTTINYFTNETPLYLVKQHISVLLDEITYLSSAYNIVEDTEEIDDLYN